MTWWLLVLAGAALWLFVAMCAVSLAVVAGRADERDDLALQRERRERDSWSGPADADQLLDEVAFEVEARLSRSA